MLEHKIFDACTDGEYIHFDYAINDGEVQWYRNKLIPCEFFLMEEDTIISEAWAENGDLVLEETHKDGMIVEVYYTLDEVLEIANIRP